MAVYIQTVNSRFEGAPVVSLNFYIENTKKKSFYEGYNVISSEILFSVHNKAMDCSLLKVVVC